MFSLRSLSFSGLGDPFAGLSSYFASCLRCFGIRVVRDFCNSLRLSRQEERLNSLVQAVALSREKEK